MRGSLFKCKSHSSLFNNIPPHEPPLQASSSPILRIRKWPICGDFASSKYLGALCKVQFISRNFIYDNEEPISSKMPTKFNFSVSSLGQCNFCFFSNLQQLEYFTKAFLQGQLGFTAVFLRLYEFLQDRSVTEPKYLL